MKFPFLILPLFAACSLTSCVVPAYHDPGAYGSVGVSYGTYATLPSHYVGDAYYYGGRYYSGGRYETGRFHDHGRAYSDRYYHNGRYYYGGRHEHHGNSGNGHGDGDRHYPGEQSGYRNSTWQSNRSVQPNTYRRVQ